LEPLSRKEFGFTVVTGAREYYICASTAKEQQEWMDAIQQCIHEATPEELAAFEQRIQDLREAAKRNPVEIAKRLGGKFTNTLRTKGANT
jgi:pyruvate dehydrogenase complex dehydrogenase (E1) component